MNAAQLYSKSDKSFSFASMIKNPFKTMTGLREKHIKNKEAIKSINIKEENINSAIKKFRKDEIKLELIQNVIGPEGAMYNRYYFTDNYIKRQMLFPENYEKIKKGSVAYSRDWAPKFDRQKMWNRELNGFEKTVKELVAVLASAQGIELSEKKLSEITLQIGKMVYLDIVKNAKQTDGYLPMDYRSIFIRKCITHVYSARFNRLNVVAEKLAGEIAKKTNSKEELKNIRSGIEDIIRYAIRQNYTTKVA